MKRKRNYQHNIFCVEQLQPEQRKGREKIMMQRMIKYWKEAKDK